MPVGLAVPEEACEGVADDMLALAFCCAMRDMWDDMAMMMMNTQETSPELHDFIQARFQNDIPHCLLRSEP